MQIKGYSNKEMSRIALGTHLGDANDEVSASYRNAIKYAVQNGIYTIDGAINYRGMRSEKDEGIAIRELIESGIVAGGMIPKVECCMIALRGGVPRSRRK